MPGGSENILDAGSVNRSRGLEIALRERPANRPRYRINRVGSQACAGPKPAKGGAALAGSEKPRIFNSEEQR
jgi:hypothetical protein